MVVVVAVRGHVSPADSIAVVCSRWHTTNTRATTTPTILDDDDDDDGINSS